MSLLTTQVRASDLMQREVVSIGPEATIKDAVGLMTEFHVSGLPVVDRQRCVGVISMSDILSFVNDGSESESDDSARHWLNPETEQWEEFFDFPLHPDQFEDSLVEEAMTSELVSVHRDCSAREVARVMQENEIHRVVVLDDDRHLCGVISAFDFVRAIAQPSLA